MKVLMVLTSCNRKPGSDRKTGAWFGDVATAYCRFADAGHVVELATPLGGPAPVDPGSMAEQFRTELTERVSANPEAQRGLANTHRLAELRAVDYDAVFYPGGLGPIFDLYHDAASIELIEAMQRAGKPVAAVSHGVAALLKARSAEGVPLVKGRKVTGFSTKEEAIVHEAGYLPFTIEDELRRLGGDYSSGPEFQPYALADGKLVTGQNPPSCWLVVDKILEVQP